MRAVRYHEYGGVPSLEDVPVPDIAAEEVLVRVEAAALNPLDVKLHSGSMQWFFKLDLPYVMGSDLAGTVARVGSAVTRLRPGDRVVGHRAPLAGGAFAEYVAVAAGQCAVLPESLTLAQGAGIPTAAGTAWSALFGTANLRAGQSVLVHAGAGGVGSFAVQFAKAAGAHVTATASGDGVAVVRGLGADRVVDYRLDDFATSVGGMDVVLDTVGFATLDRSFDVVRPGGHLVSVVMPPDAARAAAGGIQATRVYWKQEPGELSRLLGEIVRSGVTVLVDCEAPLAQFGRAFSRQASGRARGKVLVGF